MLHNPENIVQIGAALTERALYDKGVMKIRCSTRFPCSRPILTGLKESPFKNIYLECVEEVEMQKRIYFRYKVNGTYKHCVKISSHFRFKVATI